MININLLPPEIKAKLKKSRKTADIFSICLVIVILLLVVTGLLYAYKSWLLQVRLTDEKSKLTAANQTMANFNDLENKALFLNDRGKLAAQIAGTRPNWPQILQSLINAVPTDVQLNSLTADTAKSPNFVLQGTTTSEREAIKFRDKLASISFFKDVAFKSSSVSNDQNAASPSGAMKFTLEFNLAKNSSK